MDWEVQLRPHDLGLRREVQRAPVGAEHQSLGQLRKLAELGRQLNVASGEIGHLRHTLDHGGQPVLFKMLPSHDNVAPGVQTDMASACEAPGEELVWWQRPAPRTPPIDDDTPLPRLGYRTARSSRENVVSTNREICTSSRAAENQAAVVGDRLISSGGPMDWRRHRRQAWLHEHRAKGRAIAGPRVQHIRQPVTWPPLPHLSDFSHGEPGVEPHTFSPDGVPDFVLNSSSRHAGSLLGGFATSKISAPSAATSMPITVADLAFHCPRTRDHLSKTLHDGHSKSSELAHKSA